MRTLLIADDEPDIRALVRMTLQSESYRILEAGDGVEALALARSNHPQLILLDAMMPGLTGFDVCRAIKNDPDTDRIKVIMLTAKAQETDIKEGVSAGADDYLTKPFSPVRLMQLVDDVYQESQ